MGTQEIFGVPLAQETLEQLADRIASRPLLPGSGPQLIFTMNLDHVVTLRRSERFRRAYRGAGVVTADGAPVVAYARLRGARVSRITGADLFARVLPRLDPERHRCFFVLSQARHGEALTARLRRRGFAPDRLAYRVPDFGFERDEAASSALAGSIADFVPTHLFFCLGAPKSEIWCREHGRAIGDAYVLCCGAGAEFFIGAKRRAPWLMQNAGLEWLWRWGQEPRRLSHRYFIRSWGFVGAVRDDILGPWPRT
jgi:N-acetylglucosaminyldiphosphoundecaprenol N-acetyl-beta-D-mannosaminyltransferase